MSTSIQSHRCVKLHCRCCNFVGVKLTMVQRCSSDIINVQFFYLVDDFIDDYPCPSSIAITKTTVKCMCNLRILNGNQFWFILIRSNVLEENSDCKNNNEATNT